jgi:sec-independent protein translocase protein TatA
MFGLGVPELLIILVIIIALFGAKRLSGIGGALGGSIREFKQAVREDEISPAAKPESKGESKA